MTRRKNSRGRGRGRREKKVLPQVVGKVQMTREGYAFVIVEGDEDDVFVKASRTNGALNGDIVRVAVTREKTQSNRREGQVKEIIERSARPFIGILHVVRGQAWVLMQSRFMPYDISVPYSFDLEQCSGMKVAAVVDFWKKGEPTPRGHIVDILGEPGANDTEMHAILAEYALPYKFESEVENAADHISEDITEEDLKGRRDFREVLTFTIDPADAKDFDDALSFRKLENGNYEVGVHIADVTHYVKPGDIVDEEARTRGTSVYLVDRTVPMLPEKLCNKLCSLRPHEEKLTFSAVFELTPLGKVVERWYGKTVIYSDQRFSYEEAQAIIESGPKASHEGVSEQIKEAVLTLHGLASKLRKKRFAAGAISFERPEMKVEVDEKGRPVNVYQKMSKEANWLIEEFMLLANRSVAEFVATGCKGVGDAASKGRRPAKTFVYRVHDEPNQEKIENLRNFIGNFGYKMGPTNNGKDISKELNSLFAAAKDTPEYNAIEFWSQLIHFLLCTGLNIGTQSILMVIFNNHAHHQRTAGMGPHFHSLDLTGHRCMNRHAQALVVTDLLTHGDKVALLHQRLAGSANMLRHGDHQQIRLTIFLNRGVFCVMFVFLGMDTAKERFRHCNHLFVISNGIEPHRILLIV